MERLPSHYGDNELPLGQLRQGQLERRGTYSSEGPDHGANDIEIMEHQGLRLDETGKDLELLGVYCGTFTGMRTQTSEASWKASSRRALTLPDGEKRESLEPFTPVLGDFEAAGHGENTGCDRHVVCRPSSGHGAHTSR